jgi:hypothetical protein
LSERSIQNLRVPTPATLQQILEEEDAYVFTAEMLSQSADTWEAFDRLADQPVVAFFEPPSLDDRIINQYALFSLMSSAPARPDVWLSEHVHFVQRIIIQAALKWEIRDKLE